MARRVIHSCTDKVLLSTLAIQVANALEDCLNFDALETEAPKLHSQLLKKIKNSNDEGYPWSASSLSAARTGQDKR